MLTKSKSCSNIDCCRNDVAVADLTPAAGGGGCGSLSSGSDQFSYKSGRGPSGSRGLTRQLSSIHFCSRGVGAL